MSLKEEERPLLSDPKKLLNKVIIPEVESFGKLFQELSGTPLTGMEKEILKSYIFSKVTSKL